jgi:hypothetical protein
LAAGQLVVVHASESGGQFRANGIGAIDAVNGPVTRVDTAARELQVMNQTVRLENAIAPDLAAIKPGTSVRVSGLRTENGIIVATRLESVPAVPGVSLLGIVSSAEGNTAVVNGTRINLPQHSPAQALAVGSEVFVSGEWNGSTVQARRVEAQPVRNAIARAGRAIVEGLVTSHRGNQVNIGSITVQLADGVRVTGGSDRDVNVGRRVQVEIRRTGDTWLADRVILQRSDNIRGEARKIPPATSSDSRGDQESRPGRDEGTRAQDSGGRDNSGGGRDSGSSASGSSASSRPESNSSGSRSSGSGSGRSGSSSGDRSSGTGSSSGSGSRSSGSRGGIR